MTRLSYYRYALLHALMEHPLGFALAISVLALTIPTYRLVDAQRGAATAAIHAEGEANRKWAEKWANDHLLPLAEDVAGKANDRTSQALDIVKHLGDRGLTLLDHTEKDANARVKDLAERGDRGLTATLTEAHGAIGEIHELRGQLQPVLQSATQTLDTYRGIPGELGDRLGPAWSALEPEFTCRKDGAGYSGCWHSRITGLFGEALRVGGVFTQKFPVLADGITGMVSDGHAWTSKYVLPHPMTRWQKVETGLKITGGLGLGLARAGVF